MINHLAAGSLNILGRAVQIKVVGSFRGSCFILYIGVGFHGWHQWDSEEFFG